MKAKIYLLQYNNSVIECNKINNSKCIITVKIVSNILNENELIMIKI